jgi:hypothetical protein
MKQTMVRLAIAMLLWLAFGSTSALADGTGIPPLCMPGRPCSQPLYLK